MDFSRHPLAPSQSLKPANNILFNPEDGLPVQVSPTNYTQQGEKDGPQEYARGWVGQFDMGQADQIKQYNEIINAVAKGTCTLCREEVSFNPGTGSFIVFVRWIERFWANPSQIKSGAYRNEQGQICYNR